MKQVLLLDANRSYLVDSNQPSCDVFPANQGFVRKVSLGNNQYTPFPFNSVTLEEAAGVICARTTGISGAYKFQNCTLPGANVDFRVFPHRSPAFTTILTDVSIMDVILLNQKLLGIYSFESPYQYIAADVNNSGTITTLDAIHIQRVILGISNQFPGVDSWRYVPDYALSDEEFAEEFNDDPFTAEWNHPNGQLYPYLASGNLKSYLAPLDLNTSNADLFYESTWSFKAVKSGDVGLGEPNGPELSMEGFSYETFEPIEENTIFAIDMVVSNLDENNIYGYQFDALFDDASIEVIGFKPGDLASYSLENFATSSNSQGTVMKTLWYGSGREGEPTHFSLSQNETSLFRVVVKALVPISNLENIFYLKGDLKPQFYEIDGTVSPVTLKANVEIGTTPEHLFKGVYPNPVTSQVTFEIESSKAVPITFELQGLSGKPITLTGTTASGIQSYAFSQLNSLPNGPIYYRIMSGEDVMTGYFIKH